MSSVIAEDVSEMNDDLPSTTSIDPIPKQDPSQSCDSAPSDPSMLIWIGIYKCYCYIFSHAINTRRWGIFRHVNIWVRTQIFISEDSRKGLFLVGNRFNTLKCRCRCFLIMNIWILVSYELEWIVWPHWLHCTERIKSHLQKFRIRSKEEFLHYYENSIRHQFEAFKVMNIIECSSIP